MDGAGRVRRFWHITLPMLSPVIFFNLVMGRIQAVQAFTQVYLVSEGRGPRLHRLFYDDGMTASGGHGTRTRNGLRRI
ncbi:MAG: hypothetical protein KY475_20050 [Planctomycetes bacterium]|nr:hypothetical protein [Planctomycetota bacterium]